MAVTQKPEAAADRKRDVVHHQRFAGAGHVSIERLFDEVRRNLPAVWTARQAECPFLSQGLVPRIRNVIAARRAAGEVNHVVGDVHYLALGLPTKGLVLTVHDCATLQRLRGVAREVFRQFWFVLPMRRTCVVTTISTAMREELRQWVGDLASNVKVIPDCVRSEFTADPKPFSTARPVVLQVGTGWNKNVDRVAEALRGTTCHLKIIGTLSDRQRTSVSATGISFEELGKISDDEVLAAYRTCDMVVFASFYEGFGLPILEAQATGRPVITSNFGATAEAAGEGAILVDPHDVEALRRAVALLCGDAGVRGQLIARGFENVKRFAPQEVAARYVAAYQESLQPVGGGSPR